MCFEIEPKYFKMSFLHDCCVKNLGTLRILSKELYFNIWILSLNINVFWVSLCNFGVFASSCWFKNLSIFTPNNSFLFCLCWLTTFLDILPLMQFLNFEYFYLRFFLFFLILVILWFFGKLLMFLPLLKCFYFAIWFLFFYFASNFLLLFCLCYFLLSFLWSCCLWSCCL